MNVTVWNLDRLTRRPIELEEFVNVCTAAGIKDVVTFNGDVNPSSARTCAGAWQPSSR